jgi:hypothetical protein
LLPNKNFLKESFLKNARIFLFLQDFLLILFRAKIRAKKVALLPIVC